MAKGSQLSQLKSALSQAGLARQSQPSGSGKKRKRAGNRDTTLDRDKKARKLDEINQKLNPFEVKVTKLKHDVGGRKLKGVTGRPGLSKQVGIDQRKKTLLVEYEQRGRVGGVVDRRFGENDPSMAPEERMLERFTKERQRASRSSAFNLEDEDELTHYGQSLSALDDFDGTGLALEDEEEDRGQIDAQTVQKDHFGGFEDEDEDAGQDEPPKKKSKAEVMAEVMAKSKEHKFQRQAQKQQDDDTRHQLDQEFSSIRDLLFATPVDPSSSGSNSIPLGRPKPTLQPTSADEETISAPPAETIDEDYDQFVRQLAFEKRAKPKDRLKTEEEIALEEKEKLETAEKARQRRMRGEEDDGSGDELATRRGRRRRPQADDLEDDFMDEQAEEIGGLGKGLSQASEIGASGPGSGLEEGPEEGSEDEESGGEGEEEEEGEENSVASSYGEDQLSGEEEEEGEELVSRRNAPSKNGKGKAKELPFTFKCPVNHDEFLELLQHVEEDQVPVVIERIRVLHHPSLAVDNKTKLQVFCGVLIEHLLYVTSPPIPSFDLVSTLSTHIFSLSRTYPIQSAQAFVSKLAIMQKNLSRGLSRGALLPDSKTFPGPAELALLRLIGLVWSTSDLAHPVVAPAMLIMGQYLAQCRVRSLEDVVSGLLLCTLFLQYQELSRRLVPEALNFLINTCLHLAPHTLPSGKLPGSFPIPDLESDLVKPLRMGPEHASDLTPRAPNLSFLLSGDMSEQEQTKVDLLALTLTLLDKFSKLYTSVDGYIEIFNPMPEILDALKFGKLSPPLQTQHAKLRDALKKTLAFALQARKPLLLQAHKPIPIASYIPKFDTGRYDRRNDPDFERNAASKLKAMYKKEKKGAIRELRKDNRFLAEEQMKRQEEVDKGYKARITRAVGEIQTERHEQKQMEKEKQREKRRSGK